MLIEAPLLTLRRVLLCAAVLGWATRAWAEPDGSEAKAYTELFAALAQATDEIDTNIARIGNRSKLFGPDIDQFRRAVSWMRRTNAEGLSLVARAGQATDPAVRRASLAGASARMEALILVARAIGLQVSFVIVGDAAENAGQVSTTVVAILAEVGRKTRPVVDAISNTVLSAGLGPSASMPELVGGGVLLFKTPVGTVTPSAGPFKGQRVEYGDSSHKHTNVAGYTLEELKEALRRPHPPKNKLLREFVEGVRARSRRYGSQLSKEAVDRYEQLVRQALEKGVPKNGGVVCQDAAEVGIDVTTGKATRNYQLNGAPGGAHIFPVPD